jgi:hypothetical protein
MANAAEPFSKCRVACPVCAWTNEYSEIRPFSYTEAGSDTDFHPLGRVWHNAAYQAYDPLWFFMATCAKCFYTRELNAEFKGWTQDSAFRTYRQAAIRDKHLAAAAGHNGLVPFLGSHLDVETHPVESAIIQFLLGIFDELTTDQTSSLNVGRYFLRVAWLFRSQGTRQEIPGGPAAVLLKQLRAMLSEAEQTLSAYERAANNLGSFFDGKAATLVEGSERVEAELLASIAALHRSHSTLRDACNRVELELADDAGGGAAFHAFTSFDQFLIRAKQLWDDVPTTEREALVRACEYYKKAYETGRDIKEGVPQVQAAYLIAELSRRTGDFETADRYFNTMMRVGFPLTNTGGHDMSTVSRVKKLLELGREQTRLNKEAQSSSTRAKP